MRNNQNNSFNGTVLIMENNADFVEQIRRNSQKHISSVFITYADTLKQGIQELLISAFDIVCLNTSQQGSEHMLDLLFTLRDAKGTRLVLYPIETANNRAYLLNRGADVCLTTTFATEHGAENELVSVLRVLLRRCMDNHATPGLIVYLELSIDPARRKTTMSGKDIVLTTLEFDILYLLASNPGIVFSKEHIYERIWREQTCYGCKSVSDHISSLRRKLGLSTKNADYIVTLINAGYKFCP